MSTSSHHTLRKIEAWTTWNHPGSPRTVASTELSTDRGATEGLSPDAPERSFMDHTPVYSHIWRDLCL